MITNNLMNFLNEDSYKIIIMNYTKKKLTNYYSNLKFLIPNINKNIEKVSITNSILNKINQLISIYDILINNLEENLDLKKIIDKDFISEEIIFLIKKENFHYDNFKYLDKFINKFFFKELEIYTNNKFNNISDIWQIMEKEINYLDILLDKFIEMCFYGYFPIYKNLNPTNHYLKKKKKLFNENLKLWEKNIVNVKWEKIRNRFLDFYFILKTGNKGIIQKSKVILQKYFKQNKDYYTYYCDLYSDTNKSVSMNYVEDNEIIKTSIKMALEPVSINQSFFIPYSNFFITKKLMDKYKKNNYKISGNYLKKLEISELKVFGYKDKFNFVKKEQEIKLIANFGKYNKYLDDILKIFKNNTDIVIFVSGGAFQTDLESIAQLYLRKLNKKINN